MIFKKPADEVARLTAEVEAKNGPGWVYAHSVEGIGPDGRNAMIDVFSNEATSFDLRRNVHVLNGKVLEPF